MGKIVQSPIRRRCRKTTTSINLAARSSDARRVG